MKTIEKLQGECNQIRMKYEDLKKSKQDTLKEVFFILLKPLMIYYKNIYENNSYSFIHFVFHLS